jgi:hypothetical protein
MPKSVDIIDSNILNTYISNNNNNDNNIKIDLAFSKKWISNYFSK